MNALIRPLTWAGCLLLAITSSTGAAEVSFPRLSPHGFRGAFIVSPASAPAKAAVERVTKKVSAADGKIVVVAIGKADGEATRQAMDDQTEATVESIAVADRAAALDEGLLKSCRGAGALCVIASAPEAEIAELVRDTPLLRELSGVLERRGTLVLQGTAAILAGERYMDNASGKVANGWRLLPSMCLAIESATSDAQSLSKLFDEQSGLVSCMLEASAMLCIEGRDLGVLGDESVTLRLAPNAQRAAREQLLREREPVDYNEWIRSARTRTDVSFPPKVAPTPEVPSGALVIIGGGGMPAEIARKFVELGGGEEGRFVAFPTAQPDPLPPGNEAGFLKRYGAKQITVISAREQADLETPENLKSLEEATGIWFGGGRQWRFMDAYEGTKFLALFQDVLKRGGVIGGSSAGATIQGDYLVRGAPAGPQIMMCEGYERGLCFLPGTAIDQHFTQRKRQSDMTALMKVYPQYLGIGLDEATAIVVKGSIAEVLGPGAVHFYDRRKEVVADQPDYEIVRKGGSYDLKERRVLEAGEAKAP